MTQEKGFTLIEVMITVAVIGILASIAYPSYQQSVLKSHRSDGKSAVMNASALQEKWYFARNQYTNDPDDVGGSTSEEDYYDITITRACGDGTCFTMVATAKGKQLDDTECRKFTVSNTGARRAEDSAGADSTEACW